MSAPRRWLGVGDRSLESRGTDLVLGRRGRRLALVAVGLLVALAPVAAVVGPFWLNVAIRVLVFALFAVAYDFAFGYAGLHSFGHAALFGSGGYAAGYLLQGSSSSLLVVLPTAALAGATVAALMGWLGLRSRDIYFSILTLAIAQVLYVAVFIDLPGELLPALSTGGDDGIPGLHALTLAGHPVTSMLEYFYLTLAVVGLSAALLFRFAHSPYGRVLQAIEQNEERVATLGYRVSRYKIGALAVSGAFSGLAGGLYAAFQITATAELLHWLTTGETLVMLLIGGLGSLWGPMVGATIFIYLEYLLSHVRGWEIVVGTVFIGILLVAPEGIAGRVRGEDRDGSIRDRLARLRRRFLG